MLHRNAGTGKRQQPARMVVIRMGQKHTVQLFNAKLPERRLQQRKMLFPAGIDQVIAVTGLQDQAIRLSDI